MSDHEKNTRSSPSATSWPSRDANSPVNARNCDPRTERSTQHGELALLRIIVAASNPPITRRFAHIFAATALTLIRLGAWWTGAPLDRPRASRLARLDFGLAA